MNINFTLFCLQLVVTPVGKDFLVVSFDYVHGKVDSLCVPFFFPSAVDLGQCSFWVLQCVCSCQRQFARVLIVAPAYGKSAWVTFGTSP